MASVTCGHCGAKGTDVAHVTQCFYWEQEAKAEQEAESAWLRHAEYSPVQQWETDMEAAAEAWGLPANSYRY